MKVCDCEKEPAFDAGLDIKDRCDTLCAIRSNTLCVTHTLHTTLPTRSAQNAELQRVLGCQSIGHLALLRLQPATREACVSRVAGRRVWWRKGVTGGSAGGSAGGSGDGRA